MEFIVSVGDGDILKIKADNLAQLESKIDTITEFNREMINAVVIVGHECYLNDSWWKLATTPESKERRV